MKPIIGRDYCLKHPIRIAQLFGLSVLLGMLFSRDRSLLEKLAAHNELHGFPMPGEVGRAYKLAALLELRVARVYGRLADRFQANEPVHALFRELQAEEEEHSRLMWLCRYTVALHPRLQFVPRLAEAPIRDLLRRLRSIEARAEEISLKEALALTEELETSEINVIFERLLKQTEQDKSRLFEEQMALMEDHARSVPRRVAELRKVLQSKSA